ncbi:putative bifunctional diguanylate cyclase/phosphodiesterase [Flavisphingomonas formosensis]|uniref:putative bifunctional diguanylate cyclase/phosphodiesterase n=1 Tax=Flavisphingomonas formosensis TaxID=861534 RepID=UPI0012FCB332|nr:bifunctional diguanylate cyclase/phosphodiesterase [Sphingomonas formosensis]
MEGFSLKSRAVAFALAAGAVVFILALLAGAPKAGTHGQVLSALIIAIVCGVMSWGSAERAIAGTAEAVDAVSDRIVQAAEGDLLSPTPNSVSATLPMLATAVEGLFAQVRANLESVNALAMYDPVTSLPNRVKFRRDAEQLLAGIPHGSVAALLFIDLDRFKQVNDSLGHAQGDQLLMMVANRLRHVAAGEGIGGAGSELPEPIVARLAGDEFTLLFAGLRDQSHALRLARRILYGLSEPFHMSDHSLDIGASIGVALYPMHGGDLSCLMRAADVAMYEAKANGRNQVQFFTDALAAQFEDKLKLERELRQAVERNEFELVFQPQLDVRTDTIVAAEALIRWRHPTQGLRMPGSFIAAAEENGLIVDIGGWVVDAVADTLARWHRQGLSQRLTFNVSPRQLERPDFVDRLRLAVESSGAPYSKLEIEITETLAMQCSPAVLESIARLRGWGIAIAIDDFGTGYSNFARMKDMPLDRVKLDGSLIQDIVRSSETRAMVHSMINLVHGLGYEVVAERVEDDAQRQVLRVIGCDLIQGYTLSKPVDEQIFVDWISGRVTPFDQSRRVRSITSA